MTFFFSLTRLYVLKPLLLVWIALLGLTAPADSLADAPQCAPDPDVTWFDTDWEFRHCLLINANQVDATLNDFPVLVKVTLTDLIGNTQSNGEDILFTDENGTQLPHEVERYQAATGELLAWVRLSTISASDNTRFFIYYGNDSAPDQQAVNATWSNNYAMVQHLQEPGGRDTNLIDSTANANHGVVAGHPSHHPTYTSEAQFNGGRVHGGTLSPSNSPRSSLRFPPSASLNLTGALTAELWAKVDGAATVGMPTDVHDGLLWRGTAIGWGPNYQFRIAVRQSDTMTWGVSCGSTQGFFTGGAPVLDQWAHYALTFDGTTTRAYINGQLVASNTQCSGQSLVLPAADLISGYGVRPGVNERVFTGETDEIRISSTARSAAWMSSQYNNQANPQTFLSVGAQEQDRSLYAIEDFESYTVNGLNSNNAGTGWGSAWTARPEHQITDTSANPLLYVAPNGEQIMGGNRALVLNEQSPREAASRLLKNEYEGDVIYVSMLVRFNISAGNNRFAVLWFEDFDFTNVPNIGLKSNGGIGSTPDDIFVRTTASNDVYSTNITNGETYFVVGRLSKSSPGPGSVYDRYELWVNPSTLSEKPAFDTATTGNSSISSVEEIGFSVVNFQTGDRMTVDRLAIGTQWSHVVTPQDPAPPVQTCFNDDFTDSALSDDWVSSVSSGSFTPSIVNNRLRMTEASNNQATAATLQRLIPGADNLVILEFDYYAYGGSGADGLTIVLSDAAVTPQPGSFGGSLGYAQRNNGDPGFAGGWLGIGLDEFGNFSNSNEGRIGGPGFRADAVAIRGSGSGTSGYPYLAGTGSLTPGIDATGADSPHRYRIIIDSRTLGSATVSVERDISGTGASYDILVAPFNVLGFSGQAAVPDNLLLSLTGSTGGANNIHEFGDFQICADQLNPIGDQIDHFELIHSGIGITCQPENIIIRACLNADCSTEFTDEVTVNLTPSGWIGGNSVTFSGGSTSVAFQRTTAGTSTLGVDSSTPTTRPFTQTECIAAGVGPAPAQCALEFFASGLVFSVPDQPANRPNDNIRIAAVDTDTETLQCIPAFADISRNVQFWSTYVDPDATGRPVSWPVSVNGLAIGQNAASATTLNLAFDSNGETEIDLHYADAGLMQLDARYLGSPATGDEGLVMPGADTFVSYPAGFVVTPENGCSSADASCSNTWVAGTDFNLSVTAKAWQSEGDTDFSDNEPTPNFRLGGMALGHNLRAPLSGEAGTATLISYNHSSAITGRNDLTQRLTEVGVFDFTLTAPPYFGVDLGTTLSSLSARMTPADFSLTTTPGAFDAFCSLGTATAYSGQNLGWLTRPELSISAVNAQGDLTQNYTVGGFNKLVSSSLTRTTPTSDAATINAAGLPFPLALTLNEGQLDVITAGVQRFRFDATDTLLYSKTTDSRVAPFTPQVAIRLEALTDSDAVAASSLPADLTPNAAFDLRYGRIRLENSFGPETQNLIVPMRAEYFDGTAMVLNDAESCWIYSHTDASLAPLLTTLQPVADTLLAGETKPGSALTLNAPGAGNTGSAILTLGVPLWLQDDFDGDGTLSSPEARVTFGVYRGHDRIIYWREVEP